MRISKMILKNSSDINLTSQRRLKDVISVIFVIFTLKLTFNDLFVPKYQTEIEKIIAYLIVNCLNSKKTNSFFLKKLFRRHITSLMTSLFVIFLKISIKSVIFDLKTTTVHHFEILSLKICDIWVEFISK